MPDFTVEQVLEMTQRGESLERTDLRHLVLPGTKLAEANFRRADLEGANLEGADLKRANLTNVNLRDAFLVEADLQGALMQRADLEGANLEKANLKNADLSRANLEGANLEGANLDGCHLKSAQLELANLGGASAVGADISKADLREVYLGGAKLRDVNLRFAHMEKVNLEECDLTGSDLTEANLRGGNLPRAVLCRAVLERAVLDEATLTGADFTEVDLRGGSIRNAEVVGLCLTGAKLAGLNADPEQLQVVTAEWVEFAGRNQASLRVEGADLVAHYSRLRGGPTITPARTPANRYFGPGDVLRNAAMEFSAESVVEIQSRFEQCTITLAEGARVMLGEEGTLEGCRILGPGEVVVSGKFTHGNGTPSIVGPRRLIVQESGVIDGTVEQHADLTQFAFERGCVLRLNITRNHGLEGDSYVR